ncbi:flagellar protein [Paenibacillus sp. sptzw28]|uniref:TIGR03826 family flagellar region protein n=1 Tax=Paenibacillus sp. sptzw28 TaxID=715179 RepID=UPI001C6EECA6|nr:TIGR03826 family flagellar region protein [Paenibacillus sp. sptzw28]QYR22105.1 flagellar protein [Paenibacillus sp. sptzw28]
MNIDNCPRCGKLYAKNFRDVCPACIKEIDLEYSRCAEYLRKNKGATMQELSDETGVAVKLITKFIREGRISLVGAPNLGYPCEVCGIPIREGTMCESCRSRLIKETGQLKNNSSEQADKRRPSPGSFQIKERQKD